MKWDHSLIDTLEWGNQISHKEDKIKIADLIASKVENGQVIGVGSGSTSYLALIRIAERNPDGTSFHLGDPHFIRNPDDLRPARHSGYQPVFPQAELDLRWG